MFKFETIFSANPHLDVLVVGGSDNSQTLHTVEIYDVENGGSIEALYSNSISFYLLFNNAKRLKLICRNPFPEAIIGGVGTWINKKHWENFRSRETDIDHHGNRALVNFLILLTYIFIRYQ